MTGIGKKFPNSPVFDTVMNEVLRWELIIMKDSKERKKTRF